MCFLKATADSPTSKNNQIHYTTFLSKETVNITAFCWKYQNRFIFKMLHIEKQPQKVCYTEEFPDLHNTELEILLDWFIDF